MLVATMAVGPWRRRWTARVLLEHLDELCIAHEHAALCATLLRHERVAQIEK